MKNKIIARSIEVINIFITSIFMPSTHLCPSTSTSTPLPRNSSPLLSSRSFSPKTLLILSFGFLFFLSGCGEIEFPDTIPESNVPTSPLSSPLVTPQAATPTSTPTLEIEGESNPACIPIKEERDNLKDAITISQDELKTCREEKIKLESGQLSAQDASENISKYKPFIEKYLAEVPQKEYPFEKCGGLGTITAQPWYPDFVTQLESSKIIFTPLSRPLKATDFAGVCASDTGQVALFLGASYKGKSEFHMVKYFINDKKIEEAILLNGTCEICPDKFGKREKQSISLTGSSGTQTKKYQYYYDSNVITE